MTRLHRRFSICAQRSSGSPTLKRLTAALGQTPILGATVDGTDVYGPARREGLNGCNSRAKAVKQVAHLASTGACATPP